MDAIKFKDSEKKQNTFKNNAVRLVASAVFFAGLFGSLSSMLGANPVYMISSGFVVLLFEYMLSDKKHAKLTVIGACAVFVGIMLAFFGRDILNGGKILLNNLYSLSEKAQPYKYEMFTVSEKNSELGTGLMLILFGAVICAVSVIIPKKSIMALILSFTLIALCIYFAVLMNVVFFIIMITGLVAVIVTQEGKGSVLYALPVLLCTVIILSGVSATAPMESAAVSEAGNYYRDRLAVKTLYVDGTPVKISEEQKTQKTEKEEEKLEESAEFSENKNLKTVIAVLIFIVISGILLVTSKLFEKLNTRRDENKRDIESSDNSKAVSSMFRYSVMLLKAYGAEMGQSFSDIEIPLNEEYKSDYRRLLVLFNKAAFSTHEISDEEREEMLSFMNKTKEIINEKSSFKQKLLIKYRYAL